MIYLYTAFYLLSNIFHVYSMFLFSKLIFDRSDTNRIAEIAAYAAYYAINSVVFLTNHNWLLNILSNILPYFCITFMYKCSLLKRFASTFGMSIFTIGVDILIMTAQNLLKIHSLFFELGFVTNIFLTTTISIAIRFKKKSKEKYPEPPALYYISIISVPICSIILGYFSAQSLNVASIVSAVIILLINVDVLYLYDSLAEMFFKKQENELIKTQNRAYLNQISIMQESQLKIRCLRHDMNNHIHKMQDMLDSGNYQELDEYLSDTKQAIAVDRNIINSGNDTVDSILNYKLTQIKSMNVKTEYDVLLPESIGISAFDINIVLGNLLDNAIEALRYVSNDKVKELKIKIEIKQGYMKIYIANTFDGIIMHDNITRKEDSVNHGLGLKSVSQTVDKYGGLLKTVPNGTLFEASAIMYEK